MKTNNEVPVLLLTGYLGSGKTTLLNRILTNKRGIKFAVIVNDIGEVNIDADLIQQGGIVNQQDDSLVALQNGCICCTLKMDLVRQLQDIIEMQRFDYIVIEASGICEPGPIAQTICSIPQMVPDMECQPRLDAIVTVVDALRMKDEFGSGLNLTRPNIDEEDIENLVIQQIEFCNIVLLNKADEVSADELGRIRGIIRELQPKAEIIDTNYGDVDLDKIINTQMFDFDEVATSATWIQEVERHDDDDDNDDDDEHEHEPEHEHEREHPHPHHHHHHDEGEAEEYGIGTYVYYARRPFELGLFDEFVARKWPAGIIRAKGICWFKDEPDICYVFEQAGRQVSLRNAGQWYATMPKKELAELMEQQPSLRRDWDDQYGDRMQKLVFIGQHLDKELIARELDFCLV
ncbi:MAG: GTP-binding protein [Prevotella sp.]|nr:GTP-binding protein [Prevotella sp.]